MQVISPWDRVDPAMNDPIEVDKTDFAGRRWTLFWMAFRLGILSVLTAGIYRFWMKTRLRRWYWSAVRPGGHPLEYVGDPWEKLLGFLIAVVFLAFYIGVVNLLLMFASFSLFNGNFAAYLLSFVGVIPFWFYAQYRARRYVLARTRWRGIRFGLAPGAWKYARIALWHWFLTILTLGLLWPRKAFYLEKFKTDNTYYGSARMEQNGRWTGFLRPWLLFWIPSILIFCIMFGMAVMSGYLEIPIDITILIPPLVLLTPIWLPLFLVNYNIKATRYLTSQKSIAGVMLKIEPRFWRVTGIYFWGYLLAGIVSFVVLIPVALAAVAAVAAVGVDMELDLSMLEGIPTIVFTAIGIGSYFLLFLTWSAITHAFVRMPLFRHYAETFTLTYAERIATIGQRPRDEFAEAEGFAEALDVGAAI